MNERLVAAAALVILEGIHLAIHAGTTPAPRRHHASTTRLPSV